MKKNSTQDSHATLPPETTRKNPAYPRRRNRRVPQLLTTNETPKTPKNMEYIISK